MQFSRTRRQKVVSVYLIRRVLSQYISHVRLVTSETGMNVSGVYDWLSIGQLKFQNLIANNSLFIDI